MRIRLYEMGPIAMVKLLENNSFLRLRDIIGPGGLLPIGRSNWYQRVADGRAPRPVKCGRLSLYKVADVARLLDDPDGFCEAPAAGDNA